MGRTLHVDLRREDGGKITESEKQAMYDVSVEYNRGRFAKIWTCENFFCDAYDWYPNWSKFKNDKNVLDTLEKQEKKLTKELGTRTKAIKLMVKQKNVLLFNEEATKVHSFCKVQGNEYNAFLVYQALLEISKRCNTLIIDLADEGHFLLCDVRIKDGKAQPRLSELKQDIDRFCNRALLADADKSKHSALIEIAVPEGLCDELIKDVRISNPYGEEHSIQYINSRLRDLKLIQDAIRQHCDFPMFIYNIEHHYFDPSLFARKLNKDDFKDYKRSIATLMDGFGGSYFGLNPDYDAEAESYRATAFVQKLVNAGDKKMTVKILGDSDDGSI